jgi:hypothetical protein
MRSSTTATACTRGWTGGKIQLLTRTGLDWSKRYRHEALAALHLPALQVSAATARDSWAGEPPPAPVNRAPLPLSLSCAAGKVPRQPDCRLHGSGKDREFRDETTEKSWPPPTLRHRRRPELRANRKKEPSSEAAIAAQLRALILCSTDPAWLEKMAREVESKAHPR